SSEFSHESPMPWWSVVLVPGLAQLSLLTLFQATVAVRAEIQGIDGAVAREQVGVDPLNIGMVQLVAFGAALAFGLRLFASNSGLREALRLRPVPLSLIFWSMMLGVSLQFPLAEVGNYLFEIWPMPVEEQLARQRMLRPTSVGHALSLIFALVVVAPVAEELLFRGLLLPRLAVRYGAPIGLLLTSVVFGLIHLSLVTSVYAAVGGVILGFVALRTRSTIPAIVAHAAINSVPLLLPPQVVEIDGFNVVADRVYHLPLPLLAAASLAAVVSLAAIIRLSADLNE
ncbi:MAG: CPBP family intramembrane glutamic endopeptidase, partial [Myxococcota bacterium]